jgi:hypothetical protein
MENYNKTISLNGKSIKVNIAFSYHESERIISLDYWKMPVTIFINDICYDKALTIMSNMNKSKSKLEFVCNKTGVKFNDSHKKVVEHILNLN